jgi:hypothetical protein
MNRCYLFQGVGSSDAPPTSLSRWDSLTQLLRRYTLTVRRSIQCWRPCDQVVSVSCFCDRRIDRCFLFTKASVHLVLKGSSWHVSVWIQTERRIDRRCHHLDRRIIWWYCLCCSSSATRLTLLGNGPSVHPTVPRVLPSVPTCLTIALTLAVLMSSVHPTVSFLFLFFLRVADLQLGSLLQLNIHNILNMPLLIASKYILSPQICYN